MKRYILTLLTLVLTFSAMEASAQTSQPIGPPRISDLAEETLDELRRIETRQQALARDWAEARALPLVASQQDGRRVQLVGLEAGTPIYLTSLNFRAAQTTRTQQLHPGQALGLSLTGAGMEIGIWDGGVPLANHQELRGRVTLGDRVAANDHPTHVAGTMVASGVRAEARGMAYEALLRAYDWEDDATEMSEEGRRGMLVSNHSYGVITGWYYGDIEGNGDQWYWLGDPSVSLLEDYRFGRYDTEASQLDRVVVANPYYLPVIAAGNDRGDVGPRSGNFRALDRTGNWKTYSLNGRPIEADGGAEGYDSISGSALAKNVLTIGSIRANANGTVTASRFSSFGPTDDGRIKPDLVGYGEGVLSSMSAGPAAYGTSSGTSMATPNVSGSLLLLQQHYINMTGEPMQAATLKGLAIHTARDAGQPGPDYKHGWGLLDAEAAAALLTDARTNEVALMEESLANSTAFTQNVTVANEGPLRVTIAWTDLPSTRPATTGTAALNDRTPHLRNDLDLRLVHDATGQTFRPYVLDPTLPSAAAVPGDNVVDNVEQVYLPRAAAGRYTLVVSHKGTLVSKASQAFAVLVSGAEGTARPVSIGQIEAAESIDEVVLDWTTLFERAEGFYQIQRAPVSYVDDVREVGSFVTVGTVSGLGIGEQAQLYRFEEARVPTGMHLYRIFFEGTTGTFLAAEIEVDVPAPDSYAIVSSYPNPFRDQTRVVLDLPTSQVVTLEVYDLLGRRMTHVFDGTLPAGRHEMPVDGSRWAAGVYFARVATEEAVKTHRMVIVR